MYYDEDEDDEIDFDPMPSAALMTFRSLTVSVMLASCALLMILLAFVSTGTLATAFIVIAAILLAIATIVGGYGVIRGMIQIMRGVSE